MSTPIKYFVSLFDFFIASTTELVNEPATGKTSEDLFTIPLINVAVLSLEIKPVSMLILLSEIVTLAVGLSLLYFAIPAKNPAIKSVTPAPCPPPNGAIVLFASSFGNLYAKNLDDAYPAIKPASSVLYSNEIKCPALIKSLSSFDKSQSTATIMTFFSANKSLYFLPLESVCFKNFGNSCPC
ncbi:Uncharacterised protein [Chlamydia trachomatis]|nr:Uncharacterised protein [Chlamydia trachomatis]